jgi:alpha-beta hydrolase superfamily lysophospholipase
MIKSEFTFLSSNEKTKIHAIECLPKDGKYSRIFQMIHGMYEYIERYLPFFEYLTTKGFIIVGHDHLGHGQSINSKEDLGYFGKPNPNDLLIQDIHILRSRTLEKYPNLPYFICGHSMGSYLLREYICSYSERLAGIILLGTGYLSTCMSSIAITYIKIMACFKGTHHRSKFTKKISMEVGPYKKYDMKRIDLNNSWITRDPEIVRMYNEDKKVDFEFTLNGFLGMTEAILFSCNPSNVIKVKKDLPILFVSGNCDPVGDNGEGVKKSYEMMKMVGSLDVTMKLYENDRHEVLNELNRDEVYEYIRAWLDEKTLIYNKDSNINN